MITMKQIKHAIMQSKSKVGTRNVRVRIERNLGVVLSVELNGKEMSIGYRTDLQAEKEVLENGLNAAGKSATRLGNAFGTLAGTMHMAASNLTGLQYALDAMVKEQAAQIEGEKLLATFDKSSNGIEYEVNYFNQRSRFVTIPTRVDRQLLINDDVNSLAMQRLQRFEPVRKRVVVFDELDKYCQFCEVKKDEN